MDANKFYYKYYQRKFMDKSTCFEAFLSTKVSHLNTNHLFEPWAVILGSHHHCNSLRYSKSHSLGWTFDVSLIQIDYWYYSDYMSMVYDHCWIHNLWTLVPHHWHDVYVIYNTTIKYEIIALANSCKLLTIIFEIAQNIVQKLIYHL